MMQLDLFGELPLAEPPEPETCGYCVHRNATGPSEAWAPCSVLGRRHADDNPCPMFFRTLQLELACAPKRRAS